MLFLSYSQKAKDYISAHISENISVTDITEILGITESYFCNCFKKSTGYTLIEYINMLKVKQIKEMAIVKNMSLQKAGEALGINDVNYLSRLFKKHNGIGIRALKQSRQISGIISVTHTGVDV